MARTKARSTKRKTAAKPSTPKSKPATPPAATPPAPPAAGPATSAPSLDAAAIGVLGDEIKTLNDKIAELQNSQGEVTPEDQVLLDGIQTAGESLAARFKELDATLAPKG